MNIILLITAGILIYILFILWQTIKQQISGKSKLNHSLDKKLLIMLGGDKKTALRLLRNARKNNPGRSYLWYHEKVILDLERDRRY